MAAVANAERELQKAKSALDDLKPLLAEGFITRTSWSAPSSRWPGRRRTWSWPSAAATPSWASAVPLELTQARADASQSKETLRQLESAASFRLEQKRAAIAAAESRIEEATSKLALAQRAARAHRGAGRRGRDRRLQGRVLRLRAAQAPGGRPGLGQPAAAHPARHLEDGGGDEGARDRHPQGREEPEGGGARRGLPRPEAHRRGHARGHPGPGGEGAPRSEVLRGDDPGAGVRAAPAAGHDRPRRDPGGGARHRRSSCPSRPSSRRRGAPSPTWPAAGARWPARWSLGPSNPDFVVVEKGLRRGERVCLRDPGAPPSDFGSLTSE